MTPSLCVPPRSPLPSHTQVPRWLIGSDAFQETPIVEVTRQITKHNYLVRGVEGRGRGGTTW